jgi:hypothetical protein
MAPGHPNSDSSNDGNDKKDNKGKLIPAANTEELGRALTKSFRYNLVHYLYQITIS